MTGQALHAGFRGGGLLASAMSERVVSAEMNRSDASLTAGASDRRTVAMIEGISRGDAAALTAFYEAWFDRAFDLTRSLTRRDEAFCLDVVQDAMMKVIRKLRPSLGITTPASLEAWFRRVLHTTALDHLRRERRRVSREAGRTGNGPSLVAGTAGAELDEQMAWLAGELERLDGQDASLVAMRYGRGRPLGEVGEAHGMTTGVVHGRVRRLLERFRLAGKEKFHE